MDASLRIVLLVLGALIVLAVLFDAFRNKRKKDASFSARTTHTEAVNSEPVIRSIDVTDTVSSESTENTSVDAGVLRPTPALVGNIVMMSLHAPAGIEFDGEQLLSELSNTGLRFGAKQIFHHERLTESGSEICFSVAKLTKPGTFDINDPSSFAGKGLLFFADLDAASDPIVSFRKMLATAYQLSDSLQGELFEAHSTPWQQDTAENLMRNIQEYKSRKVNVHHHSTLSTAES